MKSGIDYFPLDVALDEKFELIEAEFGLTGFGVVVKLLQKIYGGQGYYVEWTKEVDRHDQWRVRYDIYRCF